jgi:hypothetical protein
VGDKDHGLIQALLKGKKFLLQLIAGNRIQGAEGFIHQEDGGISAQSPGNTDSLPLSAGEFVGIS